MLLRSCLPCLSVMEISNILGFWKELTFLGTTVQPGTVVYSGTCGGGCWFEGQGQTSCMKDGDRIDVEFSKLGKQSHYVTFDK